MKIKKLTLLLLVIVFACDDGSEFAPAVAEVVPGEEFTLSAGQSVFVTTHNLNLRIDELKGWHARGFVGPNSVASITLTQNNEQREMALQHFLQCEYEFVGSDSFCQRDDAFFERLDSISQEYSQPSSSYYREVATLSNDLKLYMLLVEPSNDQDDDFVEVEKATFVIKAAQ